MPPRVPSPAGTPPAGRAAGGRPAGPDDAGMVTVEAAIALGSLVLVTVLAVVAVAAVAASIRCTDAARELVRLAARGEPDRGREIAARLAPAGADIDVRISGGEVVAHVSAAPVALLPVRVGAGAVGALEPGALDAASAPPEGIEAASNPVGAQVRGR